MKPEWLPNSNLQRKCEACGDRYPRMYLRDGQVRCTGYGPCRRERHPRKEAP